MSKCAINNYFNILVFLDLFRLFKLLIQLIPAGEKHNLIFLLFFRPMVHNLLMSNKSSLFWWSPGVLIHFSSSVFYQSRGCLSIHTLQIELVFLLLLFLFLFATTLDADAEEAEEHQKAAWYKDGVDCPLWHCQGWRETLLKRASVHCVVFHVRSI